MQKKGSKISFHHHVFPYRFAQISLMMVAFEKLLRTALENCEELCICHAFIVDFKGKQLVQLRITSWYKMGEPMAQRYLSVRVF